MPAAKSMANQAVVLNSGFFVVLAQSDVAEPGHGHDKAKQDKPCHQQQVCPAERVDEKLEDLVEHLLDHISGNQGGHDKHRTDQHRTNGYFFVKCSIRWLHDAPPSKLVEHWFFETK
jgi:hypothetical protein